PNGNTSQFSATRTVTMSVDTDGDGMSDSYEVIWGLNPNVNDANLDKDGDGLTNIQEMRAETIPSNGASRFAISSIERFGGNPRINFFAVGNHTYRLEYRDDIASGTWNVLVDQISQDGGGLIQIVDTSATGVTKRFYRLSIEP